MKHKGVQHLCNSLHVYCRLLDLGLNRKWARRLAVAYEAVFTKMVYAV